MFLTSFNNMLAFFMAAFIRIPALRHFAIQVNQFKMLRLSKKNNNNNSKNKHDYAYVFAGEKRGLISREAAGRRA